MPEVRVGITSLGHQIGYLYDMCAMGKLVTPEYREIFSDALAMDEILQGIPSDTVIPLLCWVNEQLHNSSDVKAVDEKLIAVFLSSSPALAHRLLNYDGLRTSSGREVRLFHPIYVTYFLHYELTNFRSGERRPLTSEEDVRIAKAYFRMVELYHEANSPMPNQSSGVQDIFAERLWPMMIRQFKFNRFVDPILESMKLLVLFDEVEKMGYAEYSKAYYNYFGFESSRHFVANLMELMKPSMSGLPLEKRLGVVVVNDQFVPLLESLCIQPVSGGVAVPPSLLALKTKPVYRFAANRYCVLHWDFFYMYVYRGVLRDFHERSGIKSRVERFVDFKSQVGKRVSEQRFFAGLMKLLFHRKYEVLELDQSSKGSDAYARRGKYVYFIEMKDADFGEKVLREASYSAIRSEVEQKFVGKDGAEASEKGVRQLVRNVHEAFLKPEFEPRLRGFKDRNLLVYPIIVYTDFNFSLPKVNQDLLVAYEGLQKRMTRPLTMISIDYLFRNMHHLRNSGLREVIDRYHKGRVKKLEKYNRTMELIDALAAFSPFEEICKFDGLPSYQADQSFVREFFHSMELDEG